MEQELTSNEKGKNSITHSEYVDFCDNINCYLGGCKVSDSHSESEKQQLVLAKIRDMRDKLKTGNIHVGDYGENAFLTLDSFKQLLYDLKVDTTVIEALFPDNPK